MGSGSGCDVDRDDCKELIRRKSPINGDKIGDKEGGYQIHVILATIGYISVFTQSLCLAMAGAYFLCLETGRDFIDIELAPEYFKTAQDRLTE